MSFKVGRRALLATSGAVISDITVGRTVKAQSEIIRVGALTDLGGPYRDIEGPTGTECARQAIAEFVAANPGIQVELLQADHQNKPDVGATIARQWFDRDGVDVLIQVGNTAVALERWLTPIPRPIATRSGHVGCVSAGDSDPRQSKPNVSDRYHQRQRKLPEPSAQPVRNS